MQVCPETQYSILITGDHSTPVMFGDHSHEPVPIAIADVADVAEALGPEQVAAIHLGPLHNMTQHTVVPTEELQKQAKEQKARRDRGLGLRKEQLGVEGDQAKGDGDDVPRAGEHGDGVVLFEEILAASGSLGRFSSSELMPLILQVLER